MPEQPVTVITGTRKGIGRFLVDHYVTKGHIVVGCSRGPIEQTNPRYEHFCLDVSDENAVKLMMREVARKYERLDHVINNAGVSAMSHFLLTPAEAVERVYKTNVMGSFLFSREGAKLMKKRRFGRIVNFSTVATPLKLAGESVYASSKAAIVSLTEILAQELAPLGITVNSIGPAPVETDFIEGVPKNKIQAILDRQAIPRLATFPDIANVIDFFLRPESEFVTGQVVYLGGCR